jgi:hypothetical protein
MNWESAENQLEAIQKVKLGNSKSKTGWLIQKTG